jgi:hypothetical protein
MNEMYRNMNDKMNELTEKLRALMNKTTDRGCTESEALAAAAKVAELMDKYGLSLSQLKLDSAPDECEEGDVQFNGKRKTHPVVMCMTSIGRYTTTQPWYRRGGRCVATYTFFGLPTDVKIACWLLETFHSAMNLSYKIYAITHNGDDSPDFVHGHTVRKSFMQGMGNRLIERLDQLTELRNTPAASNGNGDGNSYQLMVLKEDNLAKALKKKNMNLRTTRLTRGDFSLNAYSAGFVAADSVAINSGELDF